MHASTAVPARVQPGCGHACASALPPCSKPTQRFLRLRAVRQGPEPWDVLDPIEQSTAPTWQQRQQQQQQQRGRFTRQQRGKRSTSTSLQDTQQLQQDQSNGSRFSKCCTIQQLYTVLQQQVLPQQQQLQGSTSQGSTVDANSSQFSATTVQEQQSVRPEQLPLQQQAVDAAAPVDQPAQVQLLPLSAQDCVAVVNQLGVIVRSQYSSSASSANPFVEDQALQHSLALVYALMEQQQQQQQPGNILPAQQLLRCVSTLAGFKYAQQAQLATWLEAAAVAQPGQAATAPAQGANAPGAGAPAAVASGSIGSYRQVLAGLRMRELSALIANLARSGVRPTNLWLLAFMQVAQQKLSTADLPQLAQLLSGLVRVGVKPTTAWLDLMESRAVQCLLEHAVRQQLPADQQQQQQAGSLAVPGVPGNGNGSRRQQQPQQRGRTGARSPAACQLHDVAQLLSALAEARHTPKPQLAAVLWSATAGSLAAADAAALVELVSALGELQLVPPAAWLQQYFAAAGSANVLQQYRPWQLAGTVAAVGRLAAASRRSNAQQQQQQQQVADVPGCQTWAQATLAAVQQQLPSFAARDLSALLSGLAFLQLQVGASQVQLVLSDLQGKLPRLNTAGLADVTEAVAALTRQQQQALGQQQQQQGRALSSSGFMEALLREVAVKLPVCPAEDLARVLLAVAAVGTRPSQLWLQAAAAQLSSKLTLLPATTLVSVLDALVTLGASLERPWVLQATAALDGRLVELSTPQLQQLLTLLLAVKVAPSEAWLDRADRAVQQLVQQQGVPDVDASGQQENCQELLLQLQQMQAQQQNVEPETPGSSSGGSSSSGTLEVEVNG